MARGWPSHVAYRPGLGQQAGRNLLTHILGRHVLTGLYSDDKRESNSRGWVHYVADSAYKDFINGYGSAPATIDSSTRKVAPVIYLGPSLINASSTVNAYIPNPSTQAIVSSGSGSVEGVTSWPARSTRRGPLSFGSGASGGRAASAWSGAGVVAKRSPR